MKTGLERLRELAMRHARTGNALTATTIKDIADQIEREQGDAAAELREFAECNGFNPEAEPRDLLASVAGSLHVARVVADLRYQAWAWVEEHGGLEKVKQQRRESVPREAYERKHRAWLDHIAECEAALGRRRDAIARLASENDALRFERSQMRQRLMPEGMEWLLEVWPKWSNGEYCKFGDWWKSDKYGEHEPQQFHKLSIYTPEQLREWGQDDGDHFGYEWDYVRPADPTYRPDKAEPPAPEVLDAEGVEIRVGDVLYYVDGREQKVNTVARLTDDGCVQFGTVNEAGYVTYCEAACIQPSQLTHRAPVISADGKPLRAGETVWSTDSGTRYTVEKVTDELIPIKCCSEMGSTVSLHPSQLTHDRPDSWERLEEDTAKNPFDYCRDVGHRLDTCENAEAYKARDIVRRAKKLAERGA